MKSFAMVASLSVTMAQNQTTQESTTQNPFVSMDQPKSGQCGLELSLLQRQACSAQFPNWAPPKCDPETHACQLAIDNCSYSCIRQEDCRDKLEATPFGDGIVYNCVDYDPERYQFVWSCDNSGVDATTSDTNHQYGFARIPDINRDVHMNDTRQIKILHANQAQNLDAGHLNNVFSSSPDSCLGNKTTSPDDLVFYEFSDLFNHHECAPQCEYELDEDGVPYQVCTTTIGYDDLYYTIPQEGKELTLTPKTGVRMLKEGLLRIFYELTPLKGTSVKLQSGQFWKLTCKTKLVDKVTDIAAVVDNISLNTTAIETAKPIDFYLDIMCCDPNDTDCQKDWCESTEKDAIPIINIGPNSDPNSRFFIKTGMDTHNRELGYFHIEELYYQGFDHNDTLINNIDIIENGCNLVDRLVEFNDRVDKASENFFVTPFMSGSGASEKFTITAKVISCPYGPFNNGERCQLGDTCSSPSRYPSSWYPGPSSGKFLTSFQIVS